MQKNDPDLWQGELPRPAQDGHKYDRGHLIVLGGVDMTGAARLTSEAAMRIGCGVCTIVSAPECKDIYLKGAPHVLFEPYEQLRKFPLHLKDSRRTAFVMGPGAGQHEDEALRQAVLGAVATRKPAVLDADALNVFADYPERLFSALNEHCVLTPHEGEFARLFPDLDGSREKRAAAAARQSGAVVLLKGAQTVIATPQGDLVVNDHASPWLATAGAGDVLAGMVGGLMAQGMDVPMAAAAAVWMHGEAALRYGPGLTAPDIIQELRGVLADLL
ncbi:MAG: NAD(P)H-hydrate dehydratase [Micavibrio aeruginosavorus]|uniref:ADP-dependent (S)-NAD(P)H-hydrate dehydratase n=1 Tax=Micavibrio aeruginosavorus TaxID=349221 RepID=A0A7T5UGT2_9BACT|nr:MAG: NAD(P)H-hydrate dehydratase [Micavibrio aeruginosavorus]